MKPFTSLDQVLNSKSLTPPSSRDAGEKVAGDFQPLFASGALGAKTSESERHGAPEIELIEVEGRVQQIVVTCSCGERTVLDCAY